MTHNTNLTVRAKHFHGTNYADSKDCALAKAARDQFKGFKAYEMIDKIVLESIDDPTVQYVYNHDSYHLVNFNDDAIQAGKLYNRIFKRTPIRTVELNIAHGTWTDNNTGKQYYAINGRLTNVPVSELPSQDNINKYGYHLLFQATDIFMGTPYTEQPTVEEAEEVQTDTPIETPVEPIVEPTETTGEPTDEELQELVKEATEDQEVEARCNVLDLYLIE